MTVMAPREAWTDERLDDLKGHMDDGFREVKGEISEVKAELKSTRSELKAEIDSTRTELKADIAKLDAKFDRLTYTLIAALIGLLATHYLG
jgi:Sec-independent protein translocase protein TatA